MNQHTIWQKYKKYMRKPKHWLFTSFAYTKITEVFIETTKTFSLATFELIVRAVQVSLSTS